MLRKYKELFVKELDVCFLANICNHTDTPECGKEKNDLEIRVFLDECDRIEYNCDYKKDYVKIPYEECEQLYKDQPITNSFTKESASLHDAEKKSNYDFQGETSKTSYLPFTLNDKFPTNWNDIKKLTKIQNSTTSIKMSSVKQKEENISACTCKAKNKQIPTPVIQTTTSVTEIAATIENFNTPKTKMDVKITKLYFNKEKTSPTVSKTEDAATEILSNGTIERKCTRNRNATINPNNKKLLTTFSPTLVSIEMTNVNNTLPSTPITEMTEVLTLNEIISTTTIRTITEINTSNAKENEIIENVMQMTTRMPEDVQKINCATKIYPKDCNRPSSWETTIKGERRDFFQILRSRYGNRVKTLRGTTHWPRRVNYVNSISNDFFYSRHNES